MDENNPNNTNASTSIPDTAKSREESTFTVNETTVMAALAYIGPLVLIPILTKKSNPFVYFHIKQGLVLLVPELIIYVVQGIFMFLSPVWSLINLGFLVLTIIGVIHALRQEEKELPLIGHYSHLINI